jgi:ribosomal protein L12E/L44/L45/RPP1/RPP2
MFSRPSSCGNPGLETVLQATALQKEQQQLLSALSALEGSLLEARQATDEQRAACARAEEAAQRRAAAVAEAKQELREAKQQTQQVGIYLFSCNSLH